MESLNPIFCTNCKEEFTEVYIFPCMHDFCSKCTNRMKNGADTICLVCSDRCHQDEIKRNVFVERMCSIKKSKTIKDEIIFCEKCGLEEDAMNAEKFCINCNQFMCDACSVRHVWASRKHIIVSKKDSKPSIPYCYKHKQSFSIYCETCNVIVCSTCCIIDLLHLDHKKSDNLEEFYVNSNSDINNRINMIDKVILEQNNFITEHKELEKTCIQNFDEVHQKIDSYAKDLKNHIDNIIKSYIDKICQIKNDLIKSIQSNLKDINDYISSLTNVKLYFQELINKGSNVDVFNPKIEFNKNDWIETKNTKLVEKIEFSFVDPNLHQDISCKLSKAFSSCENEAKDLQIINLRDCTNSACVFNQNIYAVNHKNNSVITIDIETTKYLYSIYFNNAIRKYRKNVFIMNTQKNLFLYYYNDYSDSTFLYKLNGLNKFVKLTKMTSECKFTATFHETLLACTDLSELIELSGDGDELRKIINPTNLPLNFSDFSYQLKDGQYIVTTNNNESVVVSQFDQKGNIIDFTQSSTEVNKTFTDGEKYIFILEYFIGKVTVLSTDMKRLHEFRCPGVINISFDRVNNKLLLVKNSELIYFTYSQGLNLKKINDGTMYERYQGGYICRKI